MGRRGLRGALEPISDVPIGTADGPPVLVQLVAVHHFLAAAALEPVDRKAAEPTPLGGRIPNPVDVVRPGVPDLDPLLTSIDEEGIIELYFIASPSVCTSQLRARQLG